MSKNQFRALLLASLITGFLAGLYDYMWPDPTLDQAVNFITQAQPEIEGAKLIVSGVLVLVTIAMGLASIIGLFLLKPWARNIYAGGFIVAFSLYPFMGATVKSSFSQLLYDISMVLSGVILALIYCSPVAQHYESKI